MPLTKLGGRLVLSAFVLAACAKKGANPTADTTRTVSHNDSTVVPDTVDSLALSDTLPLNEGTTCTIREADYWRSNIAQDRADSINPRNRINEYAAPFGLAPETIRQSPEQAQAALAFTKRWDTGTTLRVRFLNGSPALRDRVMRVASEWSRYANITFSPSLSLKSEIVVAFTTSGAYWSFVGTDALQPGNERWTMEFGGLNDASTDRQVRAYTLHEFGHALGLIHEHQQPSSPIQWNEPVVMSYYRKLSWTEEMVRSQIFARAAVTTTQYGAWDRFSIMEYPIPQGHTTNGYVVGWNTQLSPQDRLYISCWYYRGDEPAPTCPAETLNH